MKRSEVLAIIMSYHLPEEYADALLTDLEFVGMLPAKRQTEIKYHENDKQLLGEYVYDWEPENET
jgi:hypothetical protein